jgi:copper transport protein
MAQALAHAALVRAVPADGSVVATAPETISLTFTEPVAPLVLTLVRPDGARIALDRFALRDSTLDVTVPDRLGEGTYVLSWRVISEDGHPVAGSAVFSIGAPAAGAQPRDSNPTDLVVDGALWLAKVALYLGLFVGIGGAFFVHWIGGPARAARCAMASGLVAAGLSVGLQGLDALGLSLSGLMQGEAWTAGLKTTYGTTALVAGLALAAGLASFALSGWAGRMLSLAALVAVGVALAASGHASAAHPQWLTRPAVFLHAVGIAFWAGALLPLLAALEQGPRAAAKVLGGFSRAIPFAVIPLVLAGIVLTFIQVGSVGALTTTAYGCILLVKLGLVAVLFALAVVNRVRLTKPALSGEAKGVSRLRRSIVIETALVLAIFAVAAGWRFTPPPRALAEAAAAPASIHIHGAKAMADLTVTPGRAGPSRADIALQTGDFGALAAKEVTLVMTNPEAGVEQIKRPAIPLPDGAWRVEHLDLPVPGRWSVRIDILISDFDLVKLEGRIDIRP